MMDLIKIAEYLSCVAAVALTLFVIMFHRNISSENWFASKKKMMWATSPFALISFSLGAYLTYLVNIYTSTSAPIQRPGMKFVEADALLAARITLLCAYITFLMGVVTLKTGWSCGVRDKISLSRPFFTSLLAINLLFLQTLWEWICNAPRASRLLTILAFYCMFASWYIASGDMGMELQFHQLTKEGKELDTFFEKLAVIQGKRNIRDKNNIEDARKRLSLMQRVLPKCMTHSWNNQRSPAVELGQQV